MTIKTAPMLEAMQKAIEANPQLASSAIANARSAFNRIAKRAEPLPAEYEDVDLVQNEGPILCFRGRELASTKFTTRGRDPLTVILEVWETPAGNLIAVSTTSPAERQGDEKTHALVVEKQDDEQAMHLAVMDHFRWSNYARQMVRDQLAWNLKVEVD